MRLTGVMRRREFSQGEREHNITLPSFHSISLARRVSELARMGIKYPSYMVNLDASLRSFEERQAEKVYRDVKKGW